MYSSNSFFFCLLFKECTSMNNRIQCIEHSVFRERVVFIGVLNEFATIWKIGKIFAMWKSRFFHHSNNYPDFVKQISEGDSLVFFMTHGVSDSRTLSNLYFNWSDNRHCYISIYRRSSRRNCVPSLHSQTNIQWIDRLNNFARYYNFVTFRYW